MLRWEGSLNCFHEQAVFVSLDYKSIVRVCAVIDYPIHLNVVACSGEMTLVDGMHVLGRGGVYSGPDAQDQPT